MTYNCDGNIVFVSSTLAIVLDRSEFSQRCYAGHAQSIVCLTLNPPRNIAATGDIGEDPEIHLWDSRTSSPIMIFKRIHRFGVSSLSFSESGDTLISLGQDVYHSVNVFHSPSKTWRDGVLQYSTSVTLHTTLWVLHADSFDYPVVTGGQNCIYFLRKSGKSAEKLKGEFGKRRKIQTLLCASFVSEKARGTVITGTVSGHVYIWSNRGCIVGSVTAHETPIYVITNLKRGFLTGAKDGFIKIWSADWQNLHTYDARSFPVTIPFCCHSLGVNMSSSKLIAGFRSGDVYG